MSEIVLEGLSKTFPGGVEAVRDVSLTVDEGEFLVLVGPSGCGKSTLLRMIAGLEPITAGRVFIGDREATKLPARDRDIAMVFQTYALYPHMNVRQNLGYGLRVRGTTKQEINQRVQEVADMLGLSELMERRPAALSGGQRQRVAMGRAIARKPDAFLMDEPLSNLDAKMRVSMRASLAQLHDRVSTTTVYVTHDQVEAMTLGHRVAAMSEGRIEQVDTPQALYQQPVNLFVAAFIGSPAMNLVEGCVEGEELSFANVRIPLHPSRRPEAGGNGKVIVGIRPEDLEDAEFAESGRPLIEVTPSVVENIGADVHVIFPLDAQRVTVEEAAVEEREEARLLADEASHFNARVDPRSRAATGQRLRLAVEPPLLLRRGQRPQRDDRLTGPLLEPAQVAQSLGDKHVAARGHVPPDAGRLAHRVGDVDKGLEPDVARIAAVHERVDYRLPVDRPLPGDPSVALTQVEVTQLRQGCPDRLAELLLLDVHVVGVEVNAHVGLADHRGQPPALLGSVHEEGLVAIDRLDSHRDPTVRGEPRDRREDLGRALEVPVVRAPVDAPADRRVGHPAQHRRAHRGGGVDAALEEVASRPADLG
jgi:multiple sugar transport system ATP-binding protein